MSSADKLIEAARRGDPQARDALLKRHLSGLRAFVRLRFGAALRGRESASDLVQSVCGEVLRQFDRFGEGGDDGFRRWLYTEALRKIRDRAAFWRAERRDIAREAPGQDPDGELAVLEAYGSLTTPSQHAIGREAVERFESSFEQLSEDEREVILLARVLAFSHRDVAAQMGRSEGASRVLLHRALSNLAELMDDDTRDVTG